MPGIQTKKFGFSNRRPGGFTLVELLVAMALIIFMLSIMSQAFVIATTCVQGMKGIGEILDRARPVLNTMQRDLGAYHFDGNRRLGEPDFWKEGPPKAGYFMIWQDMAYSGGGNKAEGTTADGVKFARSAVDANHMLAFTVRLDGKNPEDFFTAQLPDIDPMGNPLPYKTALGPIFSNNPTTQTNYPEMFQLNPTRFDFTQGMVHSQWAEVAYFLVINSNTANVTPLCDLYRQVKLVLPSLGVVYSNKWNNANNVTPTAKNKGDLFEFSLRSENGKIHFNTPMDLTVPWKRQGDRAASLLAPPAGPSRLPDLTRLTMFTPFDTTPYAGGPKHPGSYSDLLISDVISFDVRVLTDDKLDFDHLSTILESPPYTTSSLNPGINTSPNPAYSDFTKNLKGTNFYRYVFDTWTMERGVLSYDLGDDSTGNWQPTAGQGNDRIPVWDRTNSKGLRINAIQISLRIWDAKTNKAREFKLIQRL